MRFLKLLMLALLVSSEVFAQGDTLEYYLNTIDQNVEPNKGWYFRRAWKEGEWWRVKDYYVAEGTLKFNGVFALHVKDTFMVAQGMFYYYHQNGALEKKVRFVNGFMEGMVKRYNETGKLVDSGLYKRGIPYKARVKWDDSGVRVFNGVYAEDGSGIGQEWEYHQNGKISSYGKTATGHLKDSTWTFYFKSGAISSIEQYENDSLKSIQCFGEDGKPEQKCIPEKMPEPPYNVLQYFASHMEYPHLAVKNAVEGNVSVRFIVKEDGSIETPKIVGHRLGSGCDEEAIRVVSSMPKWTPGKDHNRPVKVQFTQPVSFRLE